MSPRNDALVLWLIAALAPACVVLAQPEPDPETADQAVEAYLAQRGLDEELAAHLRRQLREALPEQRPVIADRLGDVYVRQFAAAREATQQQRLEDLARDLISLVPEADSFELRINLAKASYLRAEDIAERDRLRLATPEERADAERLLRTVLPTFQDIGARVGRRVDLLERREESGREDYSEEEKTALAEARRVRSLARYYAGWTSYYLGLLSNAPNLAADAMVDFGFLLNAGPGRPATVDRLPRGLLRYEHVARATLGCALCAAIRGNDIEAARWLEALDSAEGLPEELKAQMFGRRLSVLAAGKRWADIERDIRLRRQPDRSKPVEPLQAGDARLVAVLALEAMQRIDAGDRARDGIRELCEQLAQTAMTDLIARGEVGHVLDLVGRYGTQPIGQEGFIVHYVRALRAYEAARTEHKSVSPQSPDDPSADPAVGNRYKDAARAFEQTVQSGDSARFAGERVKAEVLWGMSLFYAGEFESAAARFNAAATESQDAAQKRDALWLAIVSLDRAVESGRPSLTADRDRAATLYLNSFPGTENAAKLLLRRAGGGLMDDAQAVDVLLNIPKDSALYGSARRQAVRILYQMYRRAAPSERAFAGARFIPVAEEVLLLDRDAALTAEGPASTEAAQAVVLRVRQMLDVLLSDAAPDPDKADRALVILEDVSRTHMLELAQVQDELSFRRLQMALARNDLPGAEAWMDRVAGKGGPYTQSAERQMYRRALSDFKALPADPALARRVVRFGEKVIAQFSPASLGKDSAAAGVLNAAADAAAMLWRAEKDQAMRDTAIRLDAILVSAGTPPASVLRRHAECTEVVGRKDTALECWRQLLSGLKPSTSEWFEARYQSLRLLAELEPDRAREAMRQHKVLHPELGPEPWGTLLLKLDHDLNSGVPSGGSLGAGAPANEGQSRGAAP